MARTALALQTFGVNGGALTFSAPNGAGAGNGNTIASTDQRTVLLINNINSTLTPVLTIKSHGNPVQGVIPPDLLFTIPANAIAQIWLDAVYYLGGGGGGLYAIDISTLIGITWAAVSLPGAYQ